MGDADRDLVARFRNGDLQAFALIYSRYKDRLYGFALGIVGKPAAAEDIVQEIFVRFFQNNSILASDGSVKSFLFSCAHHQAIDFTRRFANRSRPLPAEEALPLEFISPDDNAAREEELDLIRQSLLDLPIEQREVILLKIYEGMTFQEIAKIQDTPVGTVTSRYNYGLDRIRCTLEPKGARP